MPNPSLPADRIIDQSDYTALANVVANAILDGKPLVYDKDGNISVGKTTGNGIEVSPKEATNIAISIIHSLGNARTHENVHLDKSYKSFLQAEYKNQIEVIACSLLIKKGEEGYDQIMEKTLDYLSTLSKHPMHFSDNDNFHQQFKAIVASMNSAEEKGKLMSQERLDRVAVLRDTIAMKAERFGTGKHSLTLPIPAWELKAQKDELTPETCMELVADTINEFNNFLLNQKKLSISKNQARHIDIPFTQEEVDASPVPASDDEEEAMIESLAEELTSVPELPKDLSVNRNEKLAAQFASIPPAATPPLSNSYEDLDVDFDGLDELVADLRSEKAPPPPPESPPTLKVREATKEEAQVTKGLVVHFNSVNDSVDVDGPVVTV